MQLGAASLAGAVLLLTVFLGSAFIRGRFGPLERLLANWEASGANPPQLRPSAGAARTTLNFEYLERGAARAVPPPAGGPDGARSEDSACRVLGDDRPLATPAESPLSSMQARWRVIFTATPEEEAGTLYVATPGERPLLRGV